MFPGCCYLLEWHIAYRFNNAEFDVGILIFQIPSAVLRSRDAAVFRDCAIISDAMGHAAASKKVQKVNDRGGNEVTRPSAQERNAEFIYGGGHPLPLPKKFVASFFKIETLFLRVAAVT